MPWTADLWGNRVEPYTVDRGVHVWCPKCKKPMLVRGGDGTEVVRHFYHLNATDCTGESDTHVRMKVIAAHYASAAWPDADVVVEGDTGGLGEVVRRADVRIDFADRHDVLGGGIAIECQYKHESKDETRVSHDHAAAGYSTIWLGRSDFDFSENSVSLGRGDWRQWVNWWLPPISPTVEETLFDPLVAFRDGGEYHTIGTVPATFPLPWFKETFREEYEKAGYEVALQGRKSQISERFKPQGWDTKTCPWCEKDRVVSAREAKAVYNKSIRADYVCSWCGRDSNADVHPYFENNRGESV